MRGSGLVLAGASFAANGAVYGTLLARYPEIANGVHASEVVFGFVLFAAAVGGLAGSVLAPVLVRATGDAAATTVAGCVFALAALAVGLAPGPVSLGGALLALGLLDGAHDVAMNAFAVRVQQRTGGSIMGRVHAIWSLSLAGASLLGVGAAAGQVPVVVHVGVVGFCAVLLQLTAWASARRRAGADRAGPESPSVEGAAARARSNRQSSPAVAPRASRWAVPAARPVLLALAVAALAASYVESPGQEWSGLLLDRGLQAGAALAAAGPVAFSVGLVVSRLALDATVRRWGRRTTTVVAATTVTASMVAGSVDAALGGSPWRALVVLALAGLGAGPVYPLLFGAADTLSARYGVSPAATASIVSTCSRAGAISAPVAVGALTGAFGLPIVLAVMAMGGALLLPTLPRAVR